MSEYTGSFYSEGSSLKKISLLPETAFNSGKCYYEVLRVLNRNCLFLEDHLLRLHNSVSLAGVKYTFSAKDISSVIAELIQKNGLTNGNIRMVLQVQERSRPMLYTYCVPHSYPSPESYEKGVPTAVFNFVRQNPNIKQYNPAYKQQVLEFINERNIYEALLCDEENRITEGSKSNVFFIKSECVITAPGEKVLKGITREKVFTLCNKLNYKIIECPISIDTLSEMEAVFLTGTSPKILPVNRIDENSFLTGHFMMRNLMKAYDDLIMEDIARWKNK